MFLKRVVSFPEWRFWSEEKIVAQHWPDSRKIASNEKNLPVTAAEDLVGKVKKSGRNVDPHEREMPLQRATKPAARREGLWPVEQILLWNLGAKTGKGAKDLQAAAHHDEQCDGIDPMTETDHQRMLAYSLADFAGFDIFDFDCAGCHLCVPCGQV